MLDDVGHQLRGQQLDRVADTVERGRRQLLTHERPCGSRCLDVRRQAQSEWFAYTVQVHEPLLVRREAQDPRGGVQTTRTNVSDSQLLGTQPAMCANRQVVLA